MAFGLSHHIHHLHHHHHYHHHCFYYSIPSSTSQTLAKNPSCSVRLRAVPKSSSSSSPSSSPREKPIIPPETSLSQEPKPPISKERANSSQPNYQLLRRLRDGFRVDELALEILSIALPAALALAADPITSLVDTAFVGHLGSAELAAVGVSVSVFNLVSKVFNVPLLNITTSFVAEEQALINKSADGSSQFGKDHMGDYQNKEFLPSVSTSLVLAAGIGIVEAVALSAGSGSLMNIMGIPVDSPMRIPAEQFLSLRAFGAPPIVIALAAQGTFRGFKDTKTPLYAIGAGNLLNAVLDVILIFFVGLGIGGAAIATVISETLAVFLTMTLATSMAAREGPIPMAGHQICLQVWLAVSLLTDALALAGQALLASDYSQGNYGQAQQVIYRILQMGLITGIALAIILFLGFGAFSSLFTTDSEVLGIAWSGILFVAGSQPMNALAFVMDGLYYGVSDFGYAAYSMVLVGLITSVFLLAAAPVFGLAGVWTGLFLFMTLRVAAGIWRLGTKSGPWKNVLSKIEQEIN